MFDNLTPALIRAAGVFTAMLILSIIVTSVSYAYMDKAYQEEQAAKREMRLWQGKINRSVENNQIIDEFESNFLELVNQGVVGSEDRLSWFETLQSTAKKRGMPSVKYTVSKQKLLNKNNLTNQYRDIDVFKSVMTLDIKMAHEGDLFALLNDLTKADGLFTVERCDIQNISKDVIASNNMIDNNLKAYCELGWYTFKKSKTNNDRNNAG